MGSRLRAGWVAVLAGLFAASLLGAEGGWQITPARAQVASRAEEVLRRTEENRVRLIPRPVREQSFVYRVVAPPEKGKEKQEKAAEGEEAKERELGRMRLRFALESNLFEDEKVLVEQTFEGRSQVRRLACYLDPLTFKPERMESSFTFAGVDYELRGDYYFDRIMISNSSENSSYMGRLRYVEGSVDHESLPWVVLSIDFEDLARHPRYLVVNFIPEEEVYVAGVSLSPARAKWQGAELEAYRITLSYGEFAEEFTVTAAEPRLILSFTARGLRYELEEVGEVRERSEFLR